MSFKLLPTGVLFKGGNALRMLNLLLGILTSFTSGKYESPIPAAGGNGSAANERAMANADLRHIFAEKLEEKGRMPQLGAS